MEPLGILLSGSGSTYVNLAGHAAVGRIPARIAVVVASREGIAGIDRARELGHAVVVASDAGAVTEALRLHGARWVAMCGWLRYWDPPEDFRGRTANIHPSLLPAHGGKGMYGIHVHRAVIAAGERWSGCTAHLVEGGYDSGRILGQARVPVLPGDTPETLQARVQAAERELYPAVLTDLLAGRTAPRH